MENTKILRKNSDSIALIEVVIPDERNPGQGKLGVRGTGFVISARGDIATCAHVYDQIPEDQKKFLAVNLPGKLDDKKILNYRRFKAQLKKIDRQHDLAILEIVDPGEHKFEPVDKFGNLEDVAAGEDLLILGYPLANELLSSGFGITMTADQCIVSSIKRRGADGALDFFIVDTHVNNGASGSPVFHKRTGKIIGVVSRKVFSAKAASPDGKVAIDIPANMGICQPINYLEDLINQN